MSLDLNAFTTYAKVVELGSFTAAAEALKLSKSMVSRQISDLEDELKVRLLNRTTRKLSVTEAGAVVYERAARIVQEAAEAERDANCIEGAVRGKLRINAPMSFGIEELGRVMPKFLTRYPELTVDLALNDRQVDLMEEGFDVSMRISRLEDSSLIARQLAPVRQLIVGTPDYFKRHGVPRHPAELARHKFVLYSLRPRPEIFEYRDQGGKMQHVEVQSSFYCNNADAMREIVRAGQALCAAPLFLCAEELRNGTYVSVLEEWEPEPFTLHVIYPHTQHLSAKVRAFVDFSVEEFGPGKARWLMDEKVPVGSKAK